MSVPRRDLKNGIGVLMLLLCIFCSPFTELENLFCSKDVVSVVDYKWVSGMLDIVYTSGFLIFAA